jgi:phage recombination protein Bet
MDKKAENEVLAVEQVREIKEKLSYPEKLEAAQIAMIKHCVSFQRGSERELRQDEMKAIWYQIQIRRLDPMAKQIYFICDRDGKINTFNSIDGLRLSAQRSGEYKGQDGPFFCGENGQWMDVWLEKMPPKAAKVGIFRKGFEKAIYAVALYSEYGKTFGPWKQYPTVMLAKVAESLALRRTFPEELSGVYSDAESWIDSTPIKVEAEIKEDDYSFNCLACLNLFKSLTQKQQAIAVERHLELLKGAKANSLNYDQQTTLFNRLEEIRKIQDEEDQTDHLEQNLKEYGGQDESLS